MLLLPQKVSLKVRSDTPFFFSPVPIFLVSREFKSEAAGSQARAELLGGHRVLLPTDRSLPGCRTERVRVQVAGLLCRMFSVSLPLQKACHWFLHVFGVAFN